MNENARRKLENEMRFEEGVGKIINQLEECSMFDDFIIGHVSNEMKRAMQEALMSSDDAELINALVSISIKALEQPKAPTIGELLRTQLTLEAEVQKLQSEKKQLQEIKNLLQKQNETLEEQVDITSKAIQSLKAKNKQRVLVENGLKISYNKEVQPGEVLDQLRQGKPIAKIAEKFNVSRGLIYRRIQELKEAGFDIDALRKKK